MKPTPQHLEQVLSLQRTDAHVYLCALEIGVATMQDLSQKSKVSRTTLYGIVNRLKDRGLITETKRKRRRVYNAVDPEQLLEYQRKQCFELEAFLPELKKIHKRSRKHPRVTYYEGREGIKEVYADTLKERKPIIAWSDYDLMFERLGNEYCSVYPRERARRNITFKSITRNSDQARSIKKLDRGVLRETRLIECEPFNTEINIYGDKVAIMSFRSTTPFVALIEDEDTAETLRITWNLLWSKLTD